MDQETSWDTQRNNLQDQLVDGSSAVSWEDARAANLANWEERVAIHESAYGLEEFDEAGHLSQVVRHDLAAMRGYLGERPLDGLDVCHLQCHIGTDTVSLARAGAARVVGVDFSPAALASAETLAERTGVADRTEWVQTDVLDARAAVTGEFDVVYTSVGTICWLDDLDRWAAQIAGLLKPGGTLWFRDSHPIVGTIDEFAPDLRLAYRYFPDGGALQWDSPQTYVGDGEIHSSRLFEWPHSVSEVLTAMLGAGLQIVGVHEDDVLPWQFGPRMVEVDGGWAWPGEERVRIPLTWTVVARKPEGSA